MIRILIYCKMNICLITVLLENKNLQTEHSSFITPVFGTIKELILLDIGYSFQLIIILYITLDFLLDLLVIEMKTNASFSS